MSEYTDSQQNEEESVSTEESDVDKLLEKGKELTAEEVFFILENVDLSKDEDINKLSKLCNFFKGRSPAENIDFFQIINKKDKRTIWFNILNNIFDLNKVLIEMSESPSDLNSRMINNAHILVKISPEDLSYSMGNRKPNDLLEKMEDNNAYLFLAIMSASANLASQSLNGYDSGIFLRYVKRELSEGNVLDEYGVPLEYHWLSSLLKEHEEFFKVYNRVIMKYLSNVIHVPDGHIMSGKSNKYSVAELSELCKQVPNIYFPEKDDPNGLCHLISLGYQEIEREIKDNAKEVAEQVEKKSKKIIDMIKQFREVLEEYDAKMEFAKPKK